MEASIPQLRIQEEADGWFARLTSPGCTNADRRAFERWRENPDHAEAYAETERTWNTLGQIAARSEVEQLSARVWAETTRRSGRFNDKGLIFALAASLAIGAVGGAVYVGMNYTPTQTYATEAGERSIFRLDDGSQLTLNAATRLDVKMTRQRRHFTLHEGEALFVVAHDPLRAFTVSAGDSEVTALGTRFTVRRESTQTIVTLLEGKVAVDGRGAQAPVELAPGEQVRIVPAAPQLSRRTVDTDLATSWTGGRLKFRATPLVEVLDEVNRYSKTQIRLGDTTLASMPISGTFEIGDSDSMVAALRALLPVNVGMQDGGEIVLVRK